MALYTALTLKSGHDPVDLDKYVISSFLSRNYCPIAWFALFHSEQICSENLIVVSPTIVATETLKKRSPVLSLAFGQKWVDGIDEFVDSLIASEYLELDLRECYAEPSKFERHMREEFEIFSESYYSNKKSLFSRKPRINRQWRDYIDVYKDEPLFGDIE